MYASLGFARPPPEQPLCMIWPLLQWSCLCLLRQSHVCVGVGFVSLQLRLHNLGSCLSEALGDSSFVDIRLVVLLGALHTSCILSDGTGARTNTSGVAFCVSMRGSGCKVGNMRNGDGTGARTATPGVAFFVSMRSFGCKVGYMGNCVEGPFDDRNASCHDPIVSAQVSVEAVIACLVFFS